MTSRLATERLVHQIPGGTDLIGWFGYWPSFHDAEVTAIELARTGWSRISVHTFEATKEVTATGHFACHKHAIINFLLTDIRAIELAGFNHQNVLAGLTISQEEGVYVLSLVGCYGVDALIRAADVRIELVPGAPPDSQYLN